MSHAELIAEAREWVADCAWGEDADDLADLTDDQIQRGVNRHYVGGWAEFVRNTDV